jgi:hypothetical protein
MRSKPIYNMKYDLIDQDLEDTVEILGGLSRSSHARRRASALGLVRSTIGFLELHPRCSWPEVLQPLGHVPILIPPHQSGHKQQTSKATRDRCDNSVRRRRFQ